MPCGEGAEPSRNAVPAQPACRRNLRG